MTPPALLKDKYTMNLKPQVDLALLKVCGGEKNPVLLCLLLAIFGSNLISLVFPQGSESKALNLTMLTGYT